MSDETSCDVNWLQHPDRDQAGLCDNSSKALVNSEASVSPLLLTLENNGMQSDDSEDLIDAPLEVRETEYVATFDFGSAPACAEEAVTTVCDKTSESAVSIGKPCINTQMMCCETCAEIAYDTYADVAKNHAESCEPTSKYAADQQTVVEPVSAGKIMLAHTCAGDEVVVESSDDNEECCGDQSVSDNSDVNSANVASLLIADDPSDNSSSFLGDFSSTDPVQDKFSSVVFPPSSEHTEITENLPELDNQFVARKTISKPVSSARSFMDRKSRPVPLPRSNTFRIQSTSNILSTPSCRSSIPVQYETLSSIQSKICQTMPFGDECESEYALPPALNFSEIYVDHKAVNEWTIPEVQSGESDYDLLQEDTAMAADDYNRNTYCEPELVSESGLSKDESDYDVLRDDIWEDSYNGSSDSETEVLPEAGCSEPDAWSDAYDMASYQSGMKLSPPMDVRNCQLVLS